MGVDPKDPKLVQSIIEEKEKQIKLLKKNLKILGITQVQLEELIILQMEKDKEFQEIQNIKKHLVECQKENSYLKTENEELKRKNKELQSITIHETKDPSKALAKAL